MGDTLIYFGDAIKASESGKVEGYLVRFGNPRQPDIVGDFFTADTDFGFDANTTVGVYFHHGMPVKTARGDVSYRERIGTATLTQDDFGIYASAVLQKRNEYEILYNELIEQGKAGWSSGAAAHLVDREQVGGANHIKRWVIAEASVTHVPAEPRNAAISVKSLSTPDDSGPEAAPDGAMGEAESANEGNNTDEQDFVERLSEDNFVEREENPRYNEAKGRKMDNQLIERIEAVERAIKAAPAVSGVNYAQAATKSAGDLVAAIIHGHNERLADYGVKSTKDLSGQSGGQGGYLVPERTLAQVFEISGPENEIVFPRATRFVFGTSRTMNVPTLRQTSAVNGNSALNAGVSFTYVNEGGTKTETEPAFEQISFTAHKLAGITYASDEILNEAANLENMLRQMYIKALGFKRDWDYLRGTGAGEPLGILNSAAKVSVSRTTSNKVKYADIVNMWARFNSSSGMNSAVWVVSQPASAQLLWLEDTTGAPVYMPSAERSLRNGQLPPLLGLPVFISEKASALGIEGDIMLLDLSMYGVADTGGIEIASSRDYRFVNDMTTFRLVYRHDGKPLLKSPIALSASGANTTVSPFVTLAA